MEIERKFMHIMFNNNSITNKQFTSLLYRSGPADVTSDFEKKILNTLSVQTQSAFQIVDKLPDLYYYITDPTRTIDVVAIEITKLYAVADLDPWSLIHTIDTIIGVTGTSTVIVGGASLNTDPKHIKDFLTLSHRCIGIYPEGPEFSSDEKLEAVRAFKNKIPYIPKQIEKLIKPKKANDIENTKLTTRQLQVLNLIISRGASNKMIARSLSISESTVKLHVTGLLKKFNAKNRTQLAMSVNNKV